MKKLVIISMAALSTISAYASLEVNVDITDVQPIHVTMTPVTNTTEDNTTVTYVPHEQDGIKIDATTQELKNGNVLVEMTVSAQVSEDTYVVISEPAFVTNWEEEAHVRLEDRTEDGEEHLEISVTVSH